MIRLLVLLISSLVGSAQAVDFLDLYNEAARNDARYAAAKAQFLSVQERLPQAQASRLPKINLEAGYDYNSIDAETAFSSGHSDFGSYEYGVIASQPLYRKQNDAAVDLAQLKLLKPAPSWTLLIKTLCCVHCERTLMFWSRELTWPLCALKK
jgi:outer membrane protein TolC